MLTRFRPSPALIVAGFALVIAAGGTAYATVRISGSTISDHSIAGRKLINNTLTGTQIKESGLGTVPKASLAANASKVGGFTVRKIFYAPTRKSTTPKKILQLGGLVLNATCANGDLEVVMTSTVDHAHLASEMWNSAGGGKSAGLHHSDFGPHSASHLESLGDGNAYGETSFTYTPGERNDRERPGVLRQQRPQRVPSWRRRHLQQHCEVPGQRICDVHYSLPVDLAPRPIRQAQTRHRRAIVVAPASTPHSSTRTALLTRGTPGRY
jgi:hypothetical protein